MVPLKVTRPYTGLGDKDSAEFTTWLIYPHGTSEFTLWHPESHPNPQKTTVKVEAGGPLKIQFSGQHEPHILRVFATQKPSRITLDGKELTEGEAWQFDPKGDRLIIRTRAYTQGAYVVTWP